MAYKRSICAIQKRMSSVFKSFVNPLTGNVDWVAEDEHYDYVQEIARSGYGDMLFDEERNIKYRDALKNVIDKEMNRGGRVHVLDIGTGTGLLAMLACRAGASRVTACEAFQPMFQAAKKIIKNNGLDEKIDLIGKRSTEITREEISKNDRPNVLVAEVFDTELIGEGALRTFKEAHESLLMAGARCIPASGRIWIQPFESRKLLGWERPFSIDLPEFGIRIFAPKCCLKCSGTASVHDVQLDQVPTSSFLPVSDPVIVFRFNFEDGPSLLYDEEAEVSVQVLEAASRTDGVLMWWDLDMDGTGDIIISTEPNWRTGQHSNADVSQKTVVCLGDLPLLALIAAKLGASKVYSIQPNRIAGEVMMEFARANDLIDVLLVIDSMEQIEQADVIIGEPFFFSSLLPWHDIHFWYRASALRQRFPEALVLPQKGVLRAMPVCFDDLWKIRASVGHVEGFDLSAFDHIVQRAMEFCDERVEPQPLWEYPSVACGNPVDLFQWDLRSQLAPLEDTTTNLHLTNKKCNGIAFWMEWWFGDKKISTGLTTDCNAGQKPKWDWYSKQGVHFIQEPLRRNHVHIETRFSFNTGVIEFKFS